MTKKKARRILERGVVLEGGETDHDLRESFKMFRMAAVLGDTKAQIFLALRYAIGQGCRKDHRLARAWFGRAAGSGEELCEVIVPRGDLADDDRVKAFKEFLIGL